MQITHMLLWLSRNVVGGIFMFIRTTQQSIQRIPEVTKPK